MLQRSRYEVLPLAGIDERVATYVPLDAKLTITASPRKGIDRTLDVAERLTHKGYTVVPHLSARLIADRVQLKDILDRLHDTGIGEVFVVGGDPDRPVGAYESSGELLVAMAELGHQLADIGIAGYPERHPKIPDDVAIQAMWDKRRHATYIVSQICFDPHVIDRWVARLRRRGIEHPVYVGVPGPIATSRLMRITQQVGVGESMRFVSSHGAGVLRLGRGRYNPDRFIERLDRQLTRSGQLVAGLHVYTFNELSWISRPEGGRQRWHSQATSRSPAVPL